MKIIAQKSGPIVELLVEAFGAASKTHIRKMLKYNMIKVGDQLVTRAEFAVGAGDVIEYVKKSGQRKKIRPPAPILFDDDELLVAEKPAGLITFGERGTGGTSLYKMLKEFVALRSDGRQQVYVVHRLDREVSGIILFAMNAKVQQQLKKNWKETKKLYYALVEGRPQKDRDTLRTWLREGADRKVASSDRPAGAKLAVTHYRVLKVVKGHTLLEIETETGRKNQIRVHLAELGHPIVGDRRYGADATVTRRIRLHAFYLGFKHPTHGRFVEFTSPMPQGFLVLGKKDEDYK
ncbi:MAG: RluA family pseudouridine synthase [Desulfobacterales bacterium]